MYSELYLHLAAQLHLAIVRLPIEKGLKIAKTFLSRSRLNTQDQNRDFLLSLRLSETKNKVLRITCST